MDPKRYRRDFLPNNPPSNTIVLRGLNYETTETKVTIFYSKIRQLIQAMGIKVESVRLIRDMQTGKSKGFGFVKFFELNDAVALMGKYRMN